MTGEEPRRIQWSRQHPNPPGARYVGRGKGEHGKWGNPYAVEETGNPDQPWGVRDRRDPTGRWHAWFKRKPDAIAYAVSCHRRAFLHHLLPVKPADARRELAGRDLGCWCREGTPCHGDTLLEAANGLPAVSAAG
jgi:hypothetical protein